VLWRGALLGRNRRRARFVLDHDFKVDGLFGKGRDGVVEAEAVLPDLVGREDVVALTLFLAV